MVPIVTNRDERKLFAVVGAIIVAALLALLQLDFARSGRTSPISLTLTSATAWVQVAIATVIDVTRGGVTTIIRTPGLAHENAVLRASNERLRAENDELRERAARAGETADVERAHLAHPDGLDALVIGYDPEAAMRIVTIDRGSKDGVRREDGVVTGSGVVGRIVEVSPLSSKVLLIDDPTSKLPAVVQKGRWWSIAVGTSTRVKLQYVSQDAKLNIGDRVVTGEGRSFHAGILIGRISRVEPAAAGALDQTATLDPAANLSALSRVVVVPHQISQH